MRGRAGPGGFPAWTHTIGAMKATRDEKPDHAAVRVSCEMCGEWREVDLDALVERLGPDFSLSNRRSRCKLTNGCRGWNRFRYQSGVMRPLWDDKTTNRWIDVEYEERRREEAARRYVADQLRGRKLRDDPAPPGVMDDVWAIATDSERHQFTETSAAIRRGKGQR
jgi:hypothetical protein